MNPTHAAKAAQRNAESATNNSKLKDLVISDQRIVPTDPLKPYGGEKTIANAYKPALSIFPYFLPQTRAAGVATIVFAIMSIALMVSCFKSPSVWLVAAMLFAMTGAAISLHQWFFRKWGPSSITEERYNKACEDLIQSGDSHQKPIGLLEMLLLVLLMVIDGFLSGSSLTGLFSNFLTPTGAMIASVGWGVAATALLYKLIFDAALEVAINERRNSIRHLSASSNIAEQSLALQMRTAVGAKLGNDYSLQANRTSARIALALTALILAASTFCIRANPSPDAAAAPASMQPAVLST